MLKKLGLALLAVVVLFFALGLPLDSTWHVERSITIAATPETIASYLADARTWAKWSPWHEMDPAAKWEYFDATARGLNGARWDGPKLGRGVMNVVEVKPNQAVRYAMQLDGKLAADGRSMEGGTFVSGGFGFSFGGGQTTVTWTDGGDVGRNIPARYVLAMTEKERAAQIDRGLASLKKLLQDVQAASQKAAAEKPAEPPPGPTAEAK